LNSLSVLLRRLFVDPKYNRQDEARAMYEKRIAMDPKAADGYLYYASYASDRRQWELSIENHGKRILAIYDPDTLTLKNDLDQMRKDIEQVKAIKRNMDTVRKHRSLDKAEKERLLGEAQQRLDSFKTEEELTQLIDEYDKKVEENITNKWDKINPLDDEKKKEVGEAFYTLGVVCWNKSYQTPPHLMSAPERLEAVEKGMDACNDTLRLEPENHKAYAFIGLLWRQKIIAEPHKNDEYMTKWQEAHDKSKEINEKRMRRQRLQEQLDKMTKAE
jgi:hypothetical protein